MAVTEIDKLNQLGIDLYRCGDVAQSAGNNTCWLLGTESHMESSHST